MHNTNTMLTKYCSSVKFGCHFDNSPSSSDNVRYIAIRLMLLRIAHILKIDGTRLRALSSCMTS